MSLSVGSDLDCDFRRSGKLKLASKPQQMAGITQDLEALNALVDPEKAQLSCDDLKGGMGSNAFHDAMLQRRVA